MYESKDVDVLARTLSTDDEKLAYVDYNVVTTGSTAGGEFEDFAYEWAEEHVPSGVPVDTPTVHQSETSKATLPSDSHTPLKKPYRNTWYNKLFYHLETFVVKRPRLHAIWLLYLSIFPRALVILDMYSDGVVASDLYANNHSLLFALSCLFMVSPFLLVWVGSLRFVQKWLKQASSNHNSSKFYKHRILVNIFVFLYIFPPIGAIFMFMYELFWIGKDILTSIKAFYHGVNVIESKDREFVAMKVC